MSAWATAEQVIVPCPDLRDSSEIAEGKLAALLAEAVRTVKADLAGAYDEDTLDRLDPVPAWLAQLTVLKARELAFMAWRSGPGEQADGWRTAYVVLLNVVRAAPLETNTGKTVEFL